MLIGGVALGLVLGLLAGGSLMNLASVRLRWVAVLMLAVILRFGTEFLLVRGNSLVELFRLPLFFLAFVLLLAALWVNRTQPGMRLAFVGILSNTIAITANGGHMPIWIPSLETAGFKLAELASPFHTTLDADLSAEGVAEGKGETVEDQLFRGGGRCRWAAPENEQRQQSGGTDCHRDEAHVVRFTHYCPIRLPGPHGRDRTIRIGRYSNALGPT